MPFYLVQPWGRDRYRQATVVVEAARVDTADLLKALTPIWTTKAETARRIKQRVRTVLDWAKAAGYREGDNPADAVTRALPKQQAKVRHLLRRDSVGC